MMYSKLQSRNDTVPTKRNDAAAFYQQETISLAKNQILVVKFPSKPISSWLRKITQNDDASTNLDDVVLNMPHRYQLLAKTVLATRHSLVDPFNCARQPPTTSSNENQAQRLEFKIQPVASYSSVDPH
ncbi:hypothetical protein F511_05307 [Dorcoceras hygrometricum]|uniref:Uncharacterized protein n=1 Tax=Dorcoceras hygrometricum TaxID=472368 RepID=A0A2Z7CHR0_9LAMI|nr:hypothetical protein F511_05307 [Dorcoceras hygrometricum]